MKLTTLLVAFFLLLTSFLQAQQLSVEVKNAEKEPVPYATITILTPGVPKSIFSGICDAKGSLIYTPIAKDSLKIQVSATGYQPAEQWFTGASAVVSFTLQPATKAMNTVTVTARKPLVEVLPDKMVLNIENSTNAIGISALEILQKSPGVLVDKDDNIVLNGKNGVRIYIDGRPSPLASKDIAAQLRALQSSDIEAIEIITNPSSRYEAEGNAGIINIRLKRNQNLGWNGTWTGNYGIGNFSKYNTSLSVNNMTKKINFSSTLTLTDNQTRSGIRLNRIQLDTSYNQAAVITNQSKSAALRAGLDYRLSNNSSLGGLINGNLISVESVNRSLTPIGAVKAPTDKVLVAGNTTRSERFNLIGNLSYRYIDTSGREWTTDLDYGSYTLDANSFIPNRYLTPDYRTVLSTYTFGMVTPTDIRLASVKSDYERRFQNRSFAMGVKVSEVQTNNTFSFYNHVASGPEFDAGRSNQFEYTERIYAAYLQYRQTGKNISYQVGVRGEQTTSEGLLQANQEVDNKRVKRNYVDLFPSANIGINLTKNNAASLSYSRRIDRPKYQDLNPFENKLDELAYQKGNPFLRPQYSHVIEAKNMYKRKWVVGVSYSHVSDYFAQITDTLEGKRTFVTQRNLATQRVVNVSSSLPLSVTKWWNLFTTINGYRSHFKANFGEGKTIDLAVYSASIFQQYTFTLSKTLTAEMTTLYNSPTVWGGTYKVKAIGSLDIGFQKRFWDGDGNLKVSVTDIFRTMPWSGVNQFGGLDMRASGYYESRQFKAALTYRFGNKEVKAARQRKTGLDDLSERVK